jgi:hypothetical protein
MDKPLITFAIACYNQELFVREAIEGAFSQTYSPLEIIISDDCSKDSTFEIAQELASRYKGPHALRLNRNERNLGIGAHVNRFTAQARGELIVLSAGDDVSLPERTDVIYEAWNDSGRKATSLYSTFFVIDKAGSVIEQPRVEKRRGEQVRVSHQQARLKDYVRRRSPHVPGCAHAVSPRLFSEFGPLPPSIICEDTVLAFRTVLAGGLFTAIEAPLLKYRRHGANVTLDLDGRWTMRRRSFAEIRDKRCAELDQMIAIYRCVQTDTERAAQRGLISPLEYPALRRQIARETRRFELKKQLLLRNWLGRCCAFALLYCNTIRPRDLLTQLPHLFPRSLYETRFSKS